MTSVQSSSYCCLTCQHNREDECLLRGWLHTYTSYVDDEEEKACDGGNVGDPAYGTSVPQTCEAARHNGHRHVTSTIVTSSTSLY
jgi:hypothetical protein